MTLPFGAYETLINQAIQDKLSALSSDSTYTAMEKIDSSSSNNWLSQYLASQVSILLKEKFKDKTVISDQVDCVN